MNLSPKSPFHRFALTKTYRLSILGIAAFSLLTVSCDKKSGSRTYAVSAVEDPFYDTDGITIGDGSGVAQSRQVIVNIDLPAGATEMRLSEKASDLAGASIPFVRAASSYTFTSSLSALPTLYSNRKRHQTQ